MRGYLERAHSEERAHRIANLLIPTHDVLIFHTLLRIIKKEYSSLLRNGIHLRTACECRKFRNSAALAVCIRNVQFALCLFLLNLAFCNWRCLFLAVFFLYSPLLKFTIRVISVSQLGFYTHTHLLHLVLIKQNARLKGSAILKISAEFADQ